MIWFHTTVTERLALKDDGYNPLNLFEKHMGFKK